MPPAARVTDMHTCPMVTPGTPPVPHVGGPITGPGVPTVLIGGMPAAVVGDMATCVGPPDVIIKCSETGDVLLRFTFSDNALTQQKLTLTRNESPSMEV